MGRVSDGNAVGSAVRDVEGDALRRSERLLKRGKR